MEKEGDAVITLDSFSLPVVGVLNVLHAVFAAMPFPFLASREIRWRGGTQMVPSTDFMQSPYPYDKAQRNLNTIQDLSDRIACSHEILLFASLRRL